MKMKHSVSSTPCKVWVSIFRKKSLHSSLLGQIYRELFYVGTNDQIMQKGESMVSEEVSMVKSS